VVRTTATEDRGIDELWDAIRAHRDHLDGTGALEERRRSRLRDEVRAIALARLATDVDRACTSPEFDALMAKVDAREVDPYTAAASVLRGL